MSHTSDKTIRFGDIVAINSLRSKTTFQVISLYEGGAVLRHFSGPRPGLALCPSEFQTEGDMTRLVPYEEVEKYGKVDIKKRLEDTEYPFEGAAKKPLDEPCEIRPRHLIERDRITEILAAMQRRSAEGLAIPSEWIGELADRYQVIDAYTPASETPKKAYTSYRS